MSYLHIDGCDAVTIRRARRDDATALLQLAALDGAAPLGGDVLVAEVGGELWAALSLTDGRRIGDPFRPTAEALALLELRASALAPRPMSFRPGLRRTLRRVASSGSRRLEARTR
jgi:hypothetical protein